MKLYKTKKPYLNSKAYCDRDRIRTCDRLLRSNFTFNTLKTNNKPLIAYRKIFLSKKCLTLITRF